MGSQAAVVEQKETLVLPDLAALPVVPLSVGPKALPAKDGPSSSERLGGVRADFVATLGRRVMEIRSTLGKLAEEPASTIWRDDLRRRVHALTAAARLLRFSRLAEELARAETMVDRVAERGRLTEEGEKSLRELLDRLPELAWGEASLGPASQDREALARVSGGTTPTTELGAPLERPVRVVDGSKEAGIVKMLPQTLLFVGADRLADALAEEKERFEVERTGDFAAAPELARALAPDLIVLDADRQGAKELVTSLLSDSLTEDVPLVLLGRFHRPEDAAPYVALGVAKTLPKPVSPEMLRKAIVEVRAAFVRREMARAPVGEATLEELGSRLAEELRRGLCDAADARGRGMRVSFGEGSEVLAALWGAVARIRDLVTIESHGQVRFAPSGPEGALPLAPWLGAPDMPRDAAFVRTGGKTRGEKAPTLDRLSIVVADDDAAVTWFLAGVLRASGARVYEAHDGERAFELACEVSPDLVISDIVMPRMDGFALCRALKRDFALRDVPVVLLSWKEDLLQRVRELGANADGYLRKEASAQAIVQRLREILRPRLRVAERLAEGGEVRGRLEGLTPRTLLALACAHRPASTLTVRDATYLYEVEIREGRPVRATRTTTEGSFERGPGVLAHLLGVGAGRFVVSPVTAEDPAHLASARPDLSGTLAEQLLAPIASARAAQRLLSGASLMSVACVEVDLGALGPLAQATPEPARSVLHALAQGQSPRELVTGGKVPTSLVEDVLSDAAAHGAITAVIGEGGADLLTPAVVRETERLRGIRRQAAVVVPDLAEILPVAAPSTPEPISAVVDRSVTPAPVARSVEELSTKDLEEAFSAPALPATPAPPAPRSKVEPPPPIEKTMPVRVSSKAPEALPAAAVAPVSAPVAVVVAAPAPAAVAPSPVTPAPLAAAPAPAAPAPAPVVVAPVTVAPVPVRAAAAAARPVPTSLGSLIPPPVTELPTPIRAQLPSAHATHSRSLDDVVESSRPNRYRRTSTSADAGPASRKEGSKVKLSAWILFAVAGTVFAVGSRMSHQRAALAGAPEAAAPMAAEVQAPVATPPAEPEAAAPQAAEPGKPADKHEGDTADFPVMPQDLPLRTEDKVPAGQGLLEVIVGPSDTVYIDGQLRGTGPLVKVPLPPKKEPYEIRVRLRGEERLRFALVKEGRLSRLRIAPPWSR